MTLSIGLFSIHQPVSSSYAQSNALSQEGNNYNEATQDMEQSQSSRLNNQIVSGDNSILSGNNMECQDQDNLKGDSDPCSDGTISSEPGVLSITTVLRANCGTTEPTGCPKPDGLVQVFVHGTLYRQFEANSHVREGTTHTEIHLPPGIDYSIHAVGAGRTLFWEYELGNIRGDCSGRDTCNAIMRANGADVTVNFHYCRISCF